MSFLTQPALVLNKSWVAITTTTVRRALTLLYCGEAKVVEPDTYETFDFGSWSELSKVSGNEFIQTVTMKIRVPEVILLKFYNGMPDMEVVFSRRNLYRRDKMSCQYCGSMPGSEELTVDHIVPRSKGGKSSWENCVLACIKCNHTKGNKTLKESSLKLLKQPSKPHWTPMLKLNLGRLRISWEKFLSEKYWNVELEE